MIVHNLETFQYGLRKDQNFQTTNIWGTIFMKTKLMSTQLLGFGQ